MTERLLVRSRALLDGTENGRVEDAALLVEPDGTIGFAGRASDLVMPAGVQILDAPDHFIMPGLIEGHCHLVMPGDGSTGAGMEWAPDSHLLLTAVRNCRRALAHGITTLRDTGGRTEPIFALRAGIAADLTPAPRLLLCGHPLTVTGGHAHYLGGECDGINGVQIAARRMLKAGADFIKVLASGGGTKGVRSWEPYFTADEIKEACREAHRAGRQVTAHATCTQSVVDCVEAGVNGMEHCIFREGPTAFRFDKRLAAAVAERGIYVCPTLSASLGMVRRLEQKEEALTVQERQELDYRRRMIDGMTEQVGRMYRMGIRIVAGTDAGWETNLVGVDYVVGLELFLTAGMNRREALAAATSEAAEALGIAGFTGRLKAGLQADFLLVSTDPWSDWSGLKRPAAVFLGGRQAARDGQVLGL